MAVNETPTRWPLAWPVGRPRTRSRRNGIFKSYGKPVGMNVAIGRLTDEVDRLGGKLPILSTAYEVRMDGSLILNRGRPSDPGAAVYFQLKGKPMVMACDAFTETEQNVAALAGHIEAVRRQERYGVATAAESLQAFQALPAPDHMLPGRKPWRFMLGLSESWPPAGTHLDVVRDTINRHYRAEAIKAQRDQAALADLNIARDAALKEFS